MKVNSGKIFFRHTGTNKACFAGVIQVPKNIQAESRRILLIGSKHIVLDDATVNQPFLDEDSGYPLRIQDYFNEGLHSWIKYPDNILKDCIIRDCEIPSEDITKKWVIIWGAYISDEKSPKDDFVLSIEEGDPKQEITKEFNGSTLEQFLHQPLFGDTSNPCRLRYTCNLSLLDKYISTLRSRDAEYILFKSFLDKITGKEKESSFETKEEHDFRNKVSSILINEMMLNDISPRNTEIGSDSYKRIITKIKSQIEST